MKASKKEFIAEAEELLEEVGKSLLQLQTGFNPDALTSVFRSIHTIKGLSGLFGLKGMTELSHVLESLLDDLRLGKIEFTGDTINFIFRDIDILKNLITQVSRNEEPADVSDAIKEIKSFRETAKSKCKDFSIEDLGISPSILKVLSEYEEHRLKSNLKEGKGLYQIKTVYGLTDFANGLESLNSNLRSLGEVIATLPTSQEVPDGSIGFTIIFGSLSNLEDIKLKVHPAEVEETVPPKETIAPEQAPKSIETSVQSSTNTVRVDIEKLDGILSILGELMMSKGAIFRIAIELAEDFGNTSLTRDVHNVAKTFERKLTELQNHILDLRMVPMGQIFIRLEQIIKRYTREVGKKISLELFGEDTKIDKLLAEEVIIPLVHIIRNAVDHGIELPEKRKSLNKKEEGTVTLRAFSEGNNVIIKVQDDGAGFDLNKILSKAVEKKLIIEGHILEPEKIINFVFLPGLSTKEDISEVSGRGVGMDIVKEKITSIGGFINIETESNAGTAITLTLPVTLATIKALIIKVASQTFAIPLTSISETFIVEVEKIQTIEGKEFIEIRDEMFPILRVAHVFDLQPICTATFPERSNKCRKEYFGVIVGFGGRRLCFLVDDILGQFDIVTKPLGEYLKDIPGLAGAAEIGKHEIVLLIDVETLTEEAFSEGRITSAAR